MVSLLIVAVTFAVAGWILHLLLETSATRRVVRRTSAANEGDTTGAVLMAADYGAGWSSDNRRASDASGWTLVTAGLKRTSVATVVSAGATEAAQTSRVSHGCDRRMQ